MLLLDAAFEAGFEVTTLLQAGLAAPALAAALECEAPRSLAALRLLWSMRPTRPWDRLGVVQTAFELAARLDAAEAFATHPDLLLRQAVPDVTLTSGAAVVVLTLPGVWLHDVLFVLPPRVVEVRRRGEDNEMTLGRATFRSSDDLEPLARTLERWFRWTFHEFQPQVDRVLAWPAPNRATLLRAWGAIACPECGRYSLASVGEVGVAAESRE